MIMGLLTLIELTRLYLSFMDPSGFLFYEMIEIIYEDLRVTSKHDPHKVMHLGKEIRNLMLYKKVKTPSWKKFFMRKGFLI
jgi:hypothetical protein